MKIQKPVILGVGFTLAVTSIVLVLVFTVGSDTKDNTLTFVDENAFVELKQGKLQGQDNGDHFTFDRVQPRIVIV